VNELSQPAASTTRGWFPRLTEAAVVVAIIVVSTLLGVRVVQTYRAAGFAPSFYQPAFGPAVMLACGQGFRNPDTRELPPLAAFLSEQDDRFDCAALPATPATLPLDNFQTASRYLELAVGLLWTIVGVSWSRVAILSGLLFGFVAALTYALLRLGLSRPFALGLLIPAATSTPNFDLLPHLRDYAKGPFLLAIIFILGWLVTRRVDRRRVFQLSVLAGAVIGVGLGFRTDLAIAILPMVVTLATLLPSQVAAASGWSRFCCSSLRLSPQDGQFYAGTPPAETPGMSCCLDCRQNSIEVCVSNRRFTSSPANTTTRWHFRLSTATRFARANFPKA
jgi:hypothetical protein